MNRTRFASALAMAALATTLLPSPLRATITFQRTYGGKQTDNGFSVQQTADGGYIIAGQTSSFDTVHGNVYLIRTSEQGDTLWTRTFSGGSTDEPNSLLQTSDSGYIVAGTWEYPGGGYEEIRLIRTDAHGDTLWTRTLGNTGFGCECMSVRPTSDSGYIIAGGIMCYSVGRSDAYLIKTDATGDTLWTRTYGGPGLRNDEANGVQQTPDGGYIFAGYTDCQDGLSSRVWLIKTDASGETLWTRTYGSGQCNEAYSIQPGVPPVGWTLRSMGVA